MPAKLILITAPNGAKSQQIAQTLVREGLAACVNIIPGLQSIYSWQGKIEQAEENLLMVKTCAAKLAALEQRLSQIHPYSTPEFIVLSPEYISPAYSKWLTDVLEQ